MTRKEDLPNDAEAQAEGGYLQIPRRIALGGIVAFIVAVSGPSIAFLMSDNRQNLLIAAMQGEIFDLKAARADQEKSRVEMRIEAGRMQEKLSNMEALIRETRDLMREMARQPRN